jgi:hypothetical protein
MTTHTDETIASAVVLACLLIALFAILLAAHLLFLLMDMGAACCAIAGPHPNHPGPVPDDGVLADILTEIAPSDAARQAVLVDNPQRFYRFAPARRLTGEPS